MLFLLLLVLHFVLNKNLYGAIILRDLCLISETLYQLNSIFKFCTTEADICVEPDTDVELIPSGTVAESILCDLDRALVIVSFSCFLLRFNLCTMSFLSKIVSEPQFNKALVSMKVCPFDSFMGIICRKVCFAPSCVLTAASLCRGNSNVWLFSPIAVCWLVW